MKRWVAYVVALGTLLATAVIANAILLVNINNLPSLTQKIGGVSNSATSISLTFANTPTANDYFVCGLAYASGSAAATPPVGFSLIVPPTQTGALTLSMYSRLATSTDVAGPYTWSITGSAVGMAASCQEWGNVDTVNPIAGVSTVYTPVVPAGAQVLNPPSINPNISGTQPVSFYALGSETSLTPSAGWLNDGVGTKSTSGAAAKVSLTQYRQQLASTNVTTAVSGSASGTLASPAPGAFTMVLLTHVGGAPSLPIVNVTPTPQATVAPPNAQPTHLLAYTDVAGCYHNSNGTGCPQPLAGPTASGTQVQSDVTKFAKYVTHWQTDNRMTNYGHAAGIKMGSYGDFNQLHVNSGCMTSSTFASSYIAKSTSGALVFMPNVNPNVCGSFMGDPTTTGSGSLLTYANGYISSVVNAQYGPFPHDWMRADDAALPGETASYTLYCGGFFSNGGTTVGVCPGAEPQLNATTLPFLTLTPPNAAWVAGENNLFSNMSLPVIYNDATWPGYVVLNVPNVLGAQCEGCVLGQTETTYINHLNAALVFINSGVEYFYFNAVINNYAQDQFFMASMGLIDEAPSLLGAEEEANSSYPANSGVLISPLYYIIPSQPLKGSINFNPISVNYNQNSPPTNVGISTLKTSTGAYAREYASCSVYGQPYSACAFVTNPTTSNVSFPTLSRSYTHSAQYTGRGVITEFGDNGVLSVSGPAPSATMAPQTGGIYFP